MWPSRRHVFPSYLARLIRGAKHGRAGGWMRQTFRCVPVPSLRIGHLVHQAQSPVLLPRPVSGSAMLLQLLGGPTVEGRLHRRLCHVLEPRPTKGNLEDEDSLPDVASRLALPSLSESKRRGEVGSFRRPGEVGTTSTRTMSAALPTYPRDLGARGAFNGVDSL